MKPKPRTVKLKIAIRALKQIRELARSHHELHCKPIYGAYNRCAPDCTWPEYGLEAEDALNAMGEK